MRFLTFLLLAILGFISAAHVKSDSCAVNDASKLDCGYLGIDEDTCVSQGCCWEEVDNSGGSNVPWCFYKASNTQYGLYSVKTTSTGLTGVLSTLPTGSKALSDPLGDDISPLQLEVVYETEDRVNIRITDGSSDRWEIPESVIPKPTVTPTSSPNYKVTTTASPFSLTLTRVDDGSEILTLGQNLIFKDQFLQLNVAPGASASDVETFGIGENTQSTILTPHNTFSLWAHDTPSAAFNTNLYASHPFFLQILRDEDGVGTAHGGFLRSSNGMDVTHGSDGSLAFKVLGGVLDFSVFVGPSPVEVVQQYQQLIGFPKMQPYWSLGFHNCKYGYTSIEEVEGVVAGYANADIPLDTQWVDIDYMDIYKDFTVDATNFPQAEVTSFISSLHANGQKFVPIIDPGIKVEAGYDAYEEGIAADIFIKDLNGEDPYIGQVWPGPTHFPDFFHPDTQDYWTNQIAAFHALVGGDSTGGIDGLWIDMNEISNFCNEDGASQVCSIPADGSCPNIAQQTTCCLQCETVDPKNPLDFPPYSLATNPALGSKTVPPSCLHHGNITEYNAHNMFGLMEGIATQKSLEDLLQKRSFILSRSTFPSSGTHNAHWTGDNEASFADLQASIVQSANFNLFGTNMVGADICGFIGSTNEELCARWIEVGAFYPFSRDHNTLGADPQELYLWDSVAEASRTYLGLRYQMLPFLYTLMYESHMTGSPVFSPLFLNFPDDPVSPQMSSEFMWGDTLLFIPVVDNGMTSVEGYFPPDAPGRWMNLQDYSDVVAVDGEAGTTKTLDTPLTSTNIFVRSKRVVPMKVNGGMTTEENRASPFSLLVHICNCGKAQGSLFWDDGEQIELEKFTYVTFEADTFSSFWSTVIQGDVAGDIASMTIVNVQGEPSTVTLNGKTALTSYTYDADADSITVDLTAQNVQINKEFTLDWA
jgi:alpha-glucosidase (family GH31 glycosyl hydrolase)